MKVAGLAVVAVPAAVIGFVTMLTAGPPPPAATASPPDATSCLHASGKAPTLTPEQAANVQAIIDIGRARHVPPRGWAVAIATASQESGLRMLSGGDRDSRNLFQQRPSQGWGTLAQLGNRTYAINAFYGGSAAPANAGLLDIPHWQTLPLTEAAQAVQRSAFPEAYADDTALAIDQVRRRGAIELDCAKLTGTLKPARRNPDGTWPAEACTVRPDPTTHRGCLTPRTAAIAGQLTAQRWHLSCWDPHLQNPSSDHPRGKACDVTIGSLGHRPTGTTKARGDRLANKLQSQADSLGINYLIWYGRIWSAAHADEGWRPYGGGGVYDPSDITGGHYDHIHISVH